MAKKIVGIVGSYRKGGSVDQAVSAVLDAAAQGGAAVEKLYLLEHRIEFCRNCRQCTQLTGMQAARCLLEDDMAGLLAAIEGADALVLGAPVNFGGVNALTQRFLERLVVYALWPWGCRSPKLRKRQGARKPAVLITASAMPAPLGRLFTGALRGLKLGVVALGARPVATLFVGGAAQAERQPLASRLVDRARRVGRRLAG